MAKSKLIKRAHEIQVLTPTQVTEYHRCMFGYTDPATGKFDCGPVYFTKKYVKIQHPKRGEVPFLLYPYQERMMETYLNNNKVVVLSARQTGKSQTSAIFLLWFAMFNPDKTVLIAANKNANAMEMIQRISYSYESLPMWLKPGVTHDGFNKHEIKFDNGSRLVSTATSENSGRGMAISLLFLDEFAFVAKGVQEAFWTSILPTLSTGGACIMTSTPNGATDKFASIWRSAHFDTMIDDQTFVPIHIKWDEPPDRDEKFKQTQIALLGELKWKQEYECIAGSSMLTLMDENGNMYEMSIEELYEHLNPEQQLVA
jgi:hypothetical protein